jgi:hypothetical protein
MAVTPGVDVAVFVVPPDVSDAVMVEFPGPSATTRPLGDTETDVPVVRAKVAAGRPVIAAPF